MCNRCGQSLKREPTPPSSGSHGSGVGVAVLGSGQDRAQLASILKRVFLEELNSFLLVVLWHHATGTDMPACVSQVRFRANLFSEGATTQDVSSRRWQRTRAPDSSQRSPCPTETSTGFCGSALTRNLKVESQTLHIRFTLRNRHPERLDQTLPTRTRETLARRITAR